MNKTQLSVKEAAQQAGVSRQTMFRYIKDGKISATTSRDGHKQIDVSELLRVFGELQPPTTVTATVNDRVRTQSDSKPSHTETAPLVQLELVRLQAQLEIKERELELAKERIRELKDREESSSSERNRLLALIEQQSARLLMAPAEPVSTGSAAGPADKSKKSSARKKKS